MQATELQNLHTRLLTEGMSDLSVFIVNSKIWHSQLTVKMLEARVSFPVHQETYDESIWNILEGGKDDMYVYDRCGRLIEYIPFPLSILSKDNVKNAIWKAYYDDPCGPCTKNQPKATSTTQQPEEILVTTEASFNLTSRCQFDLERCDTLLADTYLAKCCAEMFGNPEVIHESSQCINVTEESCDELQMAEDCCKEVREQECVYHNESQCFDLLEDGLQTDVCCDQLETDTNDTQCLNTTSATCKEHKHNKLCCKQFIHNHTAEESHHHGTSYNFTCNDYDDIKCASLDEEQMLTRCCENSQNVTEEVEDLNYNDECQNVTKFPCDIVQFALNCCHQIKNGSKVQDSHIVESLRTSQYNKSQDDHDHHHPSSSKHKHRHHHGEINYDHKQHHKHKLGHHSSSHGDISELCSNFSLDRCNVKQNSLRRALHCCSEARQSFKCRFIVPQCDKLNNVVKCCQVILANQNEIKNQKQVQSQASTSTERSQYDSSQEDDKIKLNK